MRLGLSHRIKPKNHKVKFSINQMLRDEIKKKTIKKDLKQNKSQSKEWRLSLI
jgi:hypothetical protein